MIVFAGSHDQPGVPFVPTACRQRTKLSSLRRASRTWLPVVTVMIINVGLDYKLGRQDKALLFLLDSLIQMTKKETILKHKRIISGGLIHKR